MENQDCLFCRTNLGKILLEGELCFVCWDTYPVNPGHALVVPYRHFASYFDATEEEKRELWALTDNAKKILDQKHRPDGYNVGINVGHWAGQSIHHVHIHLIPRYQGDMENPKGGVRGVIPGKQKYLKTSAI